MKSFVIEDSFWEVFPKVEIGIVCVDGILPASQIADESAKRAARLLDHANDSAERWISSNTIIAKHNEKALGGLDKIMTRPEIASSPAGKNKRILFWQADDYMRYGLYTPDIVRKLHDLGK